MPVKLFIFLMEIFIIYNKKKEGAYLPFLLSGENRLKNHIR